VTYILDMQLNKKTCILSWYVWNSI